MIIQYEIDDDQINAISGDMAAGLVLDQVRLDPMWFVEAANSVSVSGYFGKATYEGTI